MKPDLEKAEKIIHEIAKSRGIPVSRILGPYRGRYVVAARHEAMKLCYEAGYSFPEIGRFFNRDHTTVLHAVHKLRDAHTQIS